MEFSNPNEGKDTILLLKRWLENRNNNRTFVDYFHEIGCKSIAVIDAGEIGRILYGEIKKSDIKVLWFADRNAEGLHDIDGIPVCMLKDIFDMPNVDIICVSPVYDYETVNKYLVGFDVGYRTLSMKDAVYEF